MPIYNPTIKFSLAHLILVESEFFTACNSKYTADDYHHCCCFCTFFFTKTY